MSQRCTFCGRTEKAHGGIPCVDLAGLKKAASVPVSEFEEMRKRVTRGSEYMAIGWRRYIELFGEAPHGTEKQLAALLELSSPNEWVNPI